MTTLVTGVTYTSGYQLIADQTGTLAIQTGSGPTTALYIDSSQRVAIGTTSPNSNSLQTLQFDNGTLNTALIAIAYGTTPSINLRSAAGTSTSPSATTSAPMNIVGGTTSDGTNFFNTVGIAGSIESTPTAGSHPTLIGFSTTPSGSTSRQERMRIDSSGNVGIGATSPSTYGFLTLQKYTTSAPPYLVFNNRGTATTDNVNTYNVGGILASAYRDVSDPSYIAGITFERAPFSGGASSAGSIVFRTDGNATTSVPTERMRINSSGYVTMPSQPMLSAKHTATETPGVNGTFVQWTTFVSQNISFASGVATVPIAGKYLITCSLLRNTGSTAGGVYLNVNAANVYRMFFIDSAGTTGYAMGSGQIIYSLAANDTVRFTAEQANAWYGDATGLGSFTIQLIG